MAKPKPTDLIIRVNFTVPQSLKEDWERFAQERHISMSQLVRNAVYDYQMKYKQVIPPQINPELQLLEMRLEKSLNEKITEIVSNLQPGKHDDEIDNIEEIKNSIILFLEKSGAQKSSEIAQILRLPRTMLMKVLEEMSQVDKLLTIDKGLWRVL